MLHCKKFDRINPYIRKGALIFHYSLRINHYKIHPLVFIDLHLNPCSKKDFPVASSRKNPEATTDFKSRSAQVNGMILPRLILDHEWNISAPFQMKGIILPNASENLPGIKHLWIIAIDLLVIHYASLATGP